MTDSYRVIKRPHLECRGCERIITTGVPGMEIVVLEYIPTRTLLFLCAICASNRIILDHIADELAENVDKNE